MTLDAIPVIDATAMAMVLVGPEQRILHANRSAQDLIGTMVAGRHYATAMRRPELFEAVEGTFADGRPRQARFVGQARGRDVVVEVHAAPIRLPAGQGVLVSLIDATHRQESGQILRDFVANVSHELKTPLTAIAGFVETLRGAAKDDPAARERFLGMMGGEVERMNRLVRDLLSLSQVEQSERTRPTGRVAVGDLIPQAVTRLAEVAAEQGATIRTEVAEALPDIQGDADQIAQVLSNLLENALKYGGKNILIRATMTGDSLTLEVIDNGAGIAEEHLPRLTERFYRVDDHRSCQMGGTGLGLAIAKHIVNRHRGRLRITSRLGEGSRFAVTLPTLADKN